MKLLADENSPRPIVEILRKQGHDVLWARMEFPGSKDLALLEHAEIEGRLILTLDRDFWQLAVQRRSALKRSGVVLFRVHPAVPEFGASCSFHAPREARVDRACQHNHDEPY
jgi:predicted nuclease of predicted toxin-antitoxin system